MNTASEHMIGVDLEAPMTQGMAMMIRRKMESIEQELKRLNSDHPQFVTVPEFCFITGAARSTVITWLNLGKLDGRKKGTKGKTSGWEIPYEEVERYKAEGI